MAVIMGKGCLEAIYGLMGGKGLWGTLLGASALATMGHHG